MRGSVPERSLVLEHLIEACVGSDLAPLDDDRPLGKPRGELDVVRRDDNRRAAGREAGDELAQLVLSSRIHSARRLVQADEARWLASHSAPGEHNRERESLALAAGEIARIAFVGPAEPDGLEGRPTILAGELVSDALANDVVARVLAEKRTSTGCVDVAGCRSHEPGACSKQGALAGAVRPEECHLLPAIDP